MLRLLYVSRYRFISDPGHGWLEVPIEELSALNITHLISSCSYIGKTDEQHFAYLEEDCDLAVFLTAKFGSEPDARKVACSHCWTNDTTEVYQERTFVRRLPPYPKDESYSFEAFKDYCYPDRVKEGATL